MATAGLRVTVASPDGVVFNGLAQTVICPGEQGTFEILLLHRPLVSRLIAGRLIIDGKAFPIRRGAVRVAEDEMTAVVELPG